MVQLYHMYTRRIAEMISPSLSKDGSTVRALLLGCWSLVPAWDKKLRIVSAMFPWNYRFEVSRLCVGKGVSHGDVKFYRQKSLFVWFIYKIVVTVIFSCRRFFNVTGPFGLAQKYEPGRRRWGSDPGVGRGNDSQR
ncbi:hypothetical protein EDB84DRAFT_1439773 [Lactarius hengduanensis]|nr:hypothetical protein EDB84DRAFT_1439773 [Lactarius hengduanensis]